MASTYRKAVRGFVLLFARSCFASLTLNFFFCKAEQVLWQQTSLVKDDDDEDEDETNDTRAHNDDDNVTDCNTLWAVREAMQRAEANKVYFACC